MPGLGDEQAQRPKQDDDDQRQGGSVHSMGDYINGPVNPSNSDQANGGLASADADAKGTQMSQMQR